MSSLASGIGERRQQVAASTDSHCDASDARSFRTLPNASQTPGSITVTRSSDAGLTPEILIVIDSWEEHTARAAESVAEGVEAGGGTARVVTADDATHDDLKDCDGLVMGSPVHQRTMPWPMKRFVGLTCEPAWF